MLEPNKKYPNHTIRQRTPVGTLFVSIVEDNGQPIALFINGAKTGTELAAYCESISRLGSEILSSNPVDGLNKLLVHLSSITTDKTYRDNNGVECRSGAEGIYLALLMYQQVKMKEVLDNMKDDNYRPATLNYS